MTRTFTTLAALAVICVSAPAFAHGGGHGGMGNQGMGNQGMGPAGNNKSGPTTVSWNLVTNKGTQTGNQNTTGSHHDMTGSHHDHKFLVKNRERIQRLEVELRRLILLEKKEAGLNHPFIVAKLKLDIQRVLRELGRDGVI